MNVCPEIMKVRKGSSDVPPAFHGQHIKVSQLTFIEAVKKSVTLEPVFVQTMLRTRYITFVTDVFCRWSGLGCLVFGTLGIRSLNIFGRSFALRLMCFSGLTTWSSGRRERRWWS